MLRIEVTGLVDYRWVILVGLFSEILNSLGRNVPSLLGSNLSLPATAQHAGETAQCSGRQRSAPRRRNQLVQDPGALLVVGLSKKSRNHLAERRCLVRSKRVRESARNL